MNFLKRVLHSDVQYDVLHSDIQYEVFEKSTILGRTIRIFLKEYYTRTYSTNFECLIMIYNHNSNAINAKMQSNADRF